MIVVSGFFLEMEKARYSFAGSAMDFEPVEIGSEGMPLAFRLVVFR